MKRARKETKTVDPSETPEPVKPKKPTTAGANKILRDNGGSVDVPDLTKPVEHGKAGVWNTGDDGQPMWKPYQADIPRVETKTLTTPQEVYQWMKDTYPAAMKEWDRGVEGPFRGGQEVRGGDQGSEQVRSGAASAGES